MNRDRQGWTRIAERPTLATTCTADGVGGESTLRVPADAGTRDRTALGIRDVACAETCQPALP